MNNNLLTPEITITAQCHTCRETILYGLEDCPYCGIKLDHEELAIGAINTFVINQAISSANTIKTFDPAAPLLLLVILFRALIDLPTWYELICSVVWLFPLLAISGWFVKHGRWDSNDEDFWAAKTAMKSSFKVWLAVNALSFIVLLFSDGWVKWGE